MENILVQHHWSPSRLPDITIGAPSQASARRFSTSLKGIIFQFRFLWFLSENYPPWFPGISPGPKGMVFISNKLR